VRFLVEESRRDSDRATARPVSFPASDDQKSGRGNLYAHGTGHGQARGRGVSASRLPKLRGIRLGHARAPGLSSPARFLPAAVTETGRRGRRVCSAIDPTAQVLPVVTGGSLRVHDQRTTQRPRLMSSSHDDVPKAQRDGQSYEQLIRKESYVPCSINLRIRRRWLGDDRLSM